MANGLTAGEIEAILDEAADLLLAVYRPKIQPKQIVRSYTADIRFCLHDDQLWPCKPAQWAQERIGSPTPTSPAFPVNGCGG